MLRTATDTLTVHFQNARSAMSQRVTVYQTHQAAETRLVLQFCVGDLATNGLSLVTQLPNTASRLSLLGILPQSSKGA